MLAEHDWAAAEKCRLETEKIYAEALTLTKQREIMELRVLAALRVELDDLQETHGEDPRLHAHIMTSLGSVDEEAPDDKNEGGLGQVIEEVVGQGSTDEYSSLSLAVKSKDSKPDERDQIRKIDQAFPSLE